MLLKVLDINGVKYVTSCTVTATRTITFYCHNEAKMESLIEALPFVDFQQRLLNLNTRVKFPESAVRNRLIEGECSQATMAAEPNPAGVWVLAMKYAMAGTPAPLKWEWHLKPMQTLVFYRQLLVDALDVGHELHVIVNTLTKDLCAKDKEIDQYRREGCQLRRTTVKTKPFDLLDFNEENKDLLEEATSYSEVNDVFPSSISSYSHSRELASAPAPPSTSSSSFNATTISPASSKASERSTSSSSSASVARCRKRKAQKINIDRLERKIKQRFLNPHLQFNSQSSQEDNLAEWLVEGALNGDSKKEPEPDSESGPKPVPELTLKTESPQIPSAEAAATVKTEKVEEPEKATTAPKNVTVKTEEESEPEKANTALEKENNNESLTESDQELNELREILAASMAQKREKREN